MDGPTDQWMVKAPFGVAWLPQKNRSGSLIWFPEPELFCFELFVLFYSVRIPGYKKLKENLKNGHLTDFCTEDLKRL